MIKHIHKILLTVILYLYLNLNGCFPTYKAVKADIDTLTTGTVVNDQTKVITLNNDIYLFYSGFNSTENIIYGEAVIQRFGATNSFKKNIELPLDSILAMINYEESTSGTRHFGSFLFGLTAPVLTFTGLYCITCPKCCFGSCPTVYSYDGNLYNLEAELFSECISRQLKNSDIDVLRQKPVNGRLSLKITNEALETHYTDKFNLYIVEHPPNTQVYPNTKDEITIINEPFPVRSVTTKEGINITHLLSADDENYYRTGVDKVIELKKGPVFDFLDIELPQQAGNTLKMIIKYRNTLLSTTLLYDIVLGSQGLEAINWTRKMNMDSYYAEQFNLIYESFSGIKLKLLNTLGNQFVGKLKDAGPLNWKYIAAEISLDRKKQNTLRLEFIPDNFMIDFMAFDTTQTQFDSLLIEKVNPLEVKYQNKKEIKDFVKYVDTSDDLYLRTEPGDSYTLNYYLPEDNINSYTTFIFSEGYYNEWIRGGWLMEEYDYSFDLHNIKQTLTVLADSWLENSALLEEEFFNSRIILKGKK